MVDKLERLKVIQELYLEPSSNESELSIDNWEDKVYEVDKIVDESVDMLGCRRFVVLPIPAALIILIIAQIPGSMEGLEAPVRRQQHDLG
jgi:hypothetical protein